MFLTSFIRDENGASASEYGLIFAIVGVGIGAAALAFGANVRVSVIDSAKDMYDLNTAPTAPSKK